jgi:hypothetical protein
VKLLIPPRPPCQVIIKALPLPDGDCSNVIDVLRSHMTAPSLPTLAPHLCGYLGVCVKDRRFLVLMVPHPSTLDQELAQGTNTIYTNECSMTTA